MDCCVLTLASAPARPWQSYSVPAAALAVELPDEPVVDSVTFAHAFATAAIAGFEPTRVSRLPAGPPKPPAAPPRC